MITLHRSQTGPGGTFGMLLNDGIPICVTCEDPWQQNAVGESCIPKGTYHCVKHIGPRFSNVWELQNVPGRSAILIHSGNTIKDTHGCILVGEGFGHLDGLPAVTNSIATLNMLRGVLPDKFDITIEEFYGA